MPVSAPHRPLRTPARLEQIDSLRGVAACLVVMFHYSSKYQELYGHTSALRFSVPWGHYGVNLFFMVSGFVIFMTLARTRRPMDFLVSRFSRLYPAYWCAVLLTFAFALAMPLPGKTVGLGDALLNLLMFHGLFGVTHVDNVYWTLEVELLFYAWALLVFQCRGMRHIHALLGCLLALRLCYFVAQTRFGIDLPWVAYRLLILAYIAWFTCGIMVYRLALRPETVARDLVTLAAAVTVLGVVDSWGLAVLAVSITAVLYLAATQRLGVLSRRGFVWLGTISYTLYLLHENIGWSLIRRMQAAGISANVSAAATFALMLMLASALTFSVERPAMKWIRSRYRQHEARAQRPVT